jgi:hypothetical protein
MDCVHLHENVYVHLDIELDIDDDSGKENSTVYEIYDLFVDAGLLIHKKIFNMSECKSFHNKKNSIFFNSCAKYQITPSKTFMKLWMS